MTLAELRAAALQEVGITAAGENADPEDDQLAASKYASLYDMMRTEGLVEWAATDALPDYAAIPVTMMLACVIAPAFGVSGQRLADLRAGGAIGLSPPSIAEKALRRRLAKHYVSYPVKTAYF